MAIAKIPAGYYQQFDADYSLDNPGLGYGGWRRSDIKIDTAHTAFVVMHAWDTGSPEEYAGWYRAVEYFSRAEHICREVFPPMLAAIRSSGMRLFHVVGGGRYHENHPGYRAAIELAGPETETVVPVAGDPVYDELNRFRVERVFPGARNTADIERGLARVDFAPQARPVSDEGVAENGRQLAALCRADGINHLIYMGFAINWCLLMSPGGMLDMRRYGVICSAIRQAVTAVENRETATTEAAKELALWRVSLAFGFVFDMQDIMEMLNRDLPSVKDLPTGRLT